LFALRTDLPEAHLERYLDELNREILDRLQGKLYSRITIISAFIAGRAWILTGLALKEPALLPCAKRLNFLADNQLASLGENQATITSGAEHSPARICSADRQLPSEGSPSEGSHAI
jgi:hypothetical protein